MAACGCSKLTRPISRKLRFGSQSPKYKFWLKNHRHKMQVHHATAVEETCFPPRIQLRVGQFYFGHTAQSPSAPGGRFSCCQSFARGLTPRSTGRPTACQLGPGVGTRYIVATRAKPARRGSPVSSNVRRQNSALVYVEPSYAPPSSRQLASSRKSCA